MYYKLKLPPSSRVHLIFHVSQLKRAVREYHSAPKLPLEMENEVEQVVFLEKALTWRINVGGASNTENG